MELALDLERGELPGDCLAISRSVAERALSTGGVTVVENAPASIHSARTSIVELAVQRLVLLSPGEELAGLDGISTAAPCAGGSSG